MFKLSSIIRANQGHVCQFPKTQFKNPNSRIPISHFRGCSKTPLPDSELELTLGLGQEISSEKHLEQIELSGICDLWPEWIELMKQLLRSGYFVSIGDPFGKDKLDPKDANRIRTACLNFARDRFDLIRYFSRKDIQIVAGSGCPNVDRKVVNSGKHLRDYVGTDEGHACSSCNLRGNCDRAYLNACAHEGARTVDIMRILLAYGLDFVTGAVENKQCLNKKVLESARRLLKEMVEVSKKEADCDQPNDVSQYPNQGLVSFPSKQDSWTTSKSFRENPRRRGAHQDCVPLKKGDWICYKCNFLNFAQNSKCLQCNEKPPKRQLSPGEWECDSCNYINFRRNAVCLKCEYRRPRALNSDYVHDKHPLHHGNS